MIALKRVTLLVVVLAILLILGDKYYKSTFSNQNAETIITNSLQAKLPIWILFRSQT